MDGKVFFFLVELDEEALHAGVGVPVEAAQVVAGGVIAVVGELDRLPALGAAPLAFEAPLLDLAADEGEALELAHEVGVE